MSPESRRELFQTKSQGRKPWAAISERLQRWPFFPVLQRLGWVLALG